MLCADLRPKPGGLCETAVQQGAHVFFPCVRSVLWWTLTPERIHDVIDR